MFKRAGFGFRNLPAFWSKLIQKVLEPLGEDFLVHFIDDGLVFSDNYKDHIEHLRKVLEIFQENGLI